MEDLYTSLACASTFSKLVLSRAYIQLILDEESREYVTINTHKGLFSYTRLPFGVSVALSVFQRTFEVLPAGRHSKGVYIPGRHFGEWQTR